MPLKLLRLITIKFMEIVLGRRFGKTADSASDREAERAAKTCQVDTSNIVDLNQMKAKEMDKKYGVVGIPCNLPFIPGEINPQIVTKGNPNK